jgi:acetolactate synthase-1/3 small subunit
MIAVLVGDSPGVLSRVAGLFSRRGFNIDSLAVGGTDRPGVSRMTITFEGDDALLEQVTKQLNKLIDVHKVIDLEPASVVGRELALIRVHCEPVRRPQVAQLADLFRARVVDVSKSSMVIEVSGTQEKVEALIQLLRDFGLKELVRTGPIALERGTAAGSAAQAPGWRSSRGLRPDNAGLAVSAAASADAGGAAGLVAAAGGSTVLEPSLRRGGTN